MFLNEKACRIIIALNQLEEANITRLARIARANVGHTSNTILKAMLMGYVEQYKRNRETIVRLTNEGREIANLLQQALTKIEETGNPPA